MKIVSVVGARPQFIKAAMLSRKLRNEHQEILVHTGQHYDHNMSEIFFRELSIPEPDYNLGISGGSHGKMTGSMLIALEDVFLTEKPDMVLIYGDTNSTLAAALAAAKLQIPICHVEAGVRLNIKDNPEEINRCLTDRITDLFFCATETSVKTLKKEGITQNVYFTGDLMYDAILFYKTQLDVTEVIGTNPIEIPNDFYLLTIHRQENTCDDKPLYEILTAMNSLDSATLFPVHPRSKEQVQILCKRHDFRNIKLIEPVGYLTSLRLIRDAKKIVTDSGGIQREAWFLDKQTVTILDKPLWPETHIGNVNQISKADTKEILDKLQVQPDFSKKGSPFGNGDAAEKMLQAINIYSKNKI